MIDREDLNRAIHRQSTMLLDNIGIRIRMEDLPSYPLLRGWRRIYYGTGWLSRLWCWHIRPRIDKETQGFIEAELGRIQDVIRQELLVAALAKGEELMGADHD